MNLQEFLQTADQWHELKDPEARAQAFNAGYDNIHDELIADNPHPEGSDLRWWFEAGEQMAVAHRDGREDEEYWEQNCGQMGDGFCSKAGSEECEFECPYKP